jgi:PAS domain S-box-containing protein
LRYAVERQRTEATLRRSEEEYRSLINDVFEKSMVGVIILDRELRVVWCNEAIETIFAIPRDELLGRDKRKLIDDKLKCVFEDPDDYSTRLLKAYEAQDFTERFECHVTPGAGRKEYWLEHFSQPIRSGMYNGGRIEQYADITESKRLAEQARELIAMQERQRLARDLHDSVSQTMFTCRTLSETALRRFEKDPQSAHGLLKEVVEQTGNALDEMRILLLELRPAALTQVGLKALFEQYLGPIRGRRHFNVALALDDVPPLPPDVQIALYRIVQEAINNIDKHASAKNVEVSTVDTGDSLTVTIVDDGRGFDMKDVSATSMGLNIMRERAQQIGAIVEVDSKLGTGTRIRVIWEK